VTKNYAASNHGNLVVLSPGHLAETPAPVAVVNEAEINKQF